MTNAERTAEWRRKHPGRNAAMQRNWRERRKAELESHRQRIPAPMQNLVAWTAWLIRAGLVAEPVNGGTQYAVLN